jgi:SAM-dependent methyltransferase
VADVFRNVYEDAVRASAYAELEFPGTYYLAFRDIPELLARHVHGRHALDFGCGAGRSTRFLRQLGFDTLGIDRSEPMLSQARERDSVGRYHLVGDGNLATLPASRFDLIFAAFTFDNIPTDEAKLRVLQELRGHLAGAGRMVNLVSTPEIYVHEWVSFSTKEFPENRGAGHGDPVRIVMLDVPDRRPIHDVLSTDAGYRRLYQAAGLEVVDVILPRGKADEGIAWVSEQRVAPWAIYVLRAAPPTAWQRLAADGDLAEHEAAAAEAEASGRQNTPQ